MERRAGRPSLHRSLNPHRSGMPGAARAAPGQGMVLLRDREMPAAVLLPAGFVGLGAERLLLAVADGLNAARADTRCGQSILHRVGTPVAQSQVVLGGPTLITVAFHRNRNAGMLAQE